MRLACYCIHFIETPNERELKLASKQHIRGATTLIRITFNQRKKRVWGQLYLGRVEMGLQEAQIDLVSWMFFLLLLLPLWSVSQLHFLLWVGLNVVKLRMGLLYKRQLLRWLGCHVRHWLRTLCSLGRNPICKSNSWSWDELLARLLRCPPTDHSHPSFSLHFVFIYIA